MVSKIGSRCADDVVLAADHEAEAAVETEHAAARPAVDVVDTARLEARGTIDVVAVVRVAAVDDDVALVEVREQLVDRGVDERRRHHDPHRPRLRELGAEVGDRRRPRAPSPSSSFTASALTSYPTHSWPLRIKRRTRLAPIRPRPIIPSCIASPSPKVPSLPGERGVLLRACARTVIRGRGAQREGGWAATRPRARRGRRRKDRPLPRVRRPRRIARAADAHDDRHEERARLLRDVQHAVALREPVGDHVVQSLELGVGGALSRRERDEVREHVVGVRAHEVAVVAAPLDVREVRGEDRFPGVRPERIHVARHAARPEHLLRDLVELAEVRRAVRAGDEHAVVAEHTRQFLHRLQRIGYVVEHVIRDDDVEGALGERQGRRVHDGAVDGTEARDERVRRPRRPSRPRDR